MKKTMFICNPANALRGPLDQHKVYEKAAKFAKYFDLELIDSKKTSKFHGIEAQITEEERAIELEEALKSDIIWACRGGFGSIQILPYIKWNLINKNKILIGYSDISSLHATWNVFNLGNSFYGDIPDDFEHSRNGFSLNCFMNKKKMVIDSSQNYMCKVLNQGVCNGTIFASCFTVLRSLCGTKFFPSLKNKILFIEDVDEKPWQWDNVFLSNVFMWKFK